MTRLTPEREKEDRRFVEEYPEQYRTEAIYLAEIDALRDAQLLNFMEVRKYLEDENLRLKTENQKLKCELKHVTDILDQALAEDDGEGVKFEYVDECMPKEEQKKILDKILNKTYADSCLERAEKADSGPWTAEGMCNQYSKVLGKDGYGIVIDVIPDDAQFIAHARTDVPELATRLKGITEVIRMLYEQRAFPSINLVEWLERMPEEK